MVAIAVGLAAPAWKWFRNYSFASWLSTDGHIESVEVKQITSRWGNTIENAPYMAKLLYSYDIGEKKQKGSYVREFDTQKESDEFVRDLTCKSVSIIYDPGRISESKLTDDAVASLITNRVIHGTDSPNHLDKSSLPIWLRRLLWPVVVFSLIGLALSLWIHGNTVFGRKVVTEDDYSNFSNAMLIIWIIALFIGHQRAGNELKRNYGMALLRGAEDWMRYMIYFFFGYDVINFAFHLAFSPYGHFSRHVTDTDIAVWRAFSGNWMFMYSAAFAILYSAATDSKKGIQCSNGHPIYVTDTFCVYCGQKINRIATLFNWL